MDQKFFIQPFAFGGDRTVVPEPVQPAGTISFNQGWGFDYQRELGVDPLAKPIERGEMNYLFYAVTDAVGALQRQGAPEFITSANNGGTPYLYGRGAIVRHGSPLRTFISMVDSNNADPTDATKWAPFVFEVATNAQALAGTDNTTIMTPLRTKALIDSTAAVVPDATETVKGIAELANTAEAQALTDDTRIVTPLKLGQAIPAASTTVVGRMRIATSGEASAMALGTVAVPPSGLTFLAPKASPQFSGNVSMGTGAAGGGPLDISVGAPGRLMVRNDRSCPGVAAVNSGNSAYVTFNVEASGFTWNGVGVATSTDIATRVAKTGDTMTGNLDINAGTTSRTRYLSGTVEYIVSATSTASTATLGTVSNHPVQLYTNNALRGTLRADGVLDMAYTIKAAPSGFSPTSSAYANVGFLAVGSYGGGYTMQDGATYGGMWMQSGELSFGTGASGLTRHLYTTASGTVSAGGFQNGSSRELKTIDGPIPYGLDELLGVETAIGSYKADYCDDGGRKRLFVIAEDLLAHGVTAPVFEDSIQYGDRKVAGVDYTQLVPWVMKALREENERRIAETANLRAELANLRALVESLTHDR
jgi:hypothetical protein